jgi:hypothetical protein
MSKFEDIKKKKKQAEKKPKISKVSEMKRQMDDEKREILTNKGEYDRNEHLRRKFLKDLFSKKLPVTVDVNEKAKELFESRYQKFFEKYIDQEDMVLFMGLLYILNSSENFGSVLSKILNKIKTKELGADIKSKKGGLSNAYDTSVILELANVIIDSPQLVQRYNRKKFLDKNEVEMKLVDKFGTLENIIEKQKKLLEELYQKMVRLNSLWMKNVKKDKFKVSKKTRQIPIPEEETLIESQDDQKRYDTLLDISLLLEEKPEDAVIKIDDIIQKIDEDIVRKTQNNELFKELIKLHGDILKYENKKPVNVIDIELLKKTLKNVLRFYDEMYNNTILSLIDAVKEDSVLSRRYETWRDILDPILKNKTLYDKYGSLDNLSALKAFEIAELLSGVRIEEIDESPVVKPKKEEEEEEIEEEEEKEEKDEEEYEYFPLRQKKEEGTFFKKQDKKEKENPILYELDIPLKNMSQERKERLKNTGLRELMKFFDKNSAIELNNNFFEDSENKTLKDYVQRLGEIIILLDENYMKSYAKLLNERLKNEYYDVPLLSSLSYKELLQDFYANPSITDFKELEDLIDQHLDKFTYNFMIYLPFVKLEKLDSPYYIDNIFDIDIDIERIDVRDIDLCNPEYKERPIFKNYIEYKEKYKKSDNLKEQTELLTLINREYKKIRPYLYRNIVYYKDTDTNILYCFSYFELEKRFNNNDYQNPYTGKMFSDDFIRDFDTIVKHKKDKGKYKEKVVSPIKDIPLSSFAKIVFENINSLEHELKDNLPKKDSCNYYQDFVLNKNSVLEPILNKDKEIINEIMAYCDFKQKSPQRSPSPPLKLPSSPQRSPSPRSPSQRSPSQRSPSQRSPSQRSPSSVASFSYPSFVLEDKKQNVKEKKKHKLPLMEEEEYKEKSKSEEEPSSDEEEEDEEVSKGKSKSEEEPSSDEEEEEEESESKGKSKIHEPSSDEEEEEEEVPKGKSKSEEEVSKVKKSKLRIDDSSDEEKSKEESKTRKDKSSKLLLLKKLESQLLPDI